MVIRPAASSDGRLTHGYARQTEGLSVVLADRCECMCACDPDRYLGKYFSSTRPFSRHGSEPQYVMILCATFRLGSSVPRQKARTDCRSMGILSTNQGNLRHMLWYCHRFSVHAPVSLLLPRPDCGWFEVGYPVEVVWLWASDDGPIYRSDFGASTTRRTKLACVLHHRRRTEVESGVDTTVFFLRNNGRLACHTLSLVQPFSSWKEPLGDYCP